MGNGQIRRVGAEFFFFFRQKHAAGDGAEGFSAL